MFFWSFCESEYDIISPMKTVFFLQSATSPSNQAMLSGTLRAAKSFGWQLRVIEFFRDSSFNRHPVNSTDDLAAEIADLQRFWMPIGIIVDCGGIPRRLDHRQFKLPTVFLDCSPEHADRGAICVYSDAEEIGRLAARELLSLNVRAYAYASFTVNNDWSVNRARAFAQAIRLNHQPCYVFSKRASDGLYVRELDRWLVSLPKPVAIFAANDRISELVVASAHKNGFGIPDDIAVLGVDNDEHICMRSEPTLSSIKPDHEKAGYLAAQLLNEMIQNQKHPPTSAMFNVIAILHRASTRALHRHDERTMKLLRKIREQATTGLSVAQLVTGFGVSRRTMEMQFREATGKSILQEIQDLRIEQAKLMLTQTSASMDEVASSSGYPSTQAFRKYFTKSIGLSPLAFRQRSKTNSI